MISLQKNLSSLETSHAASIAPVLKGLTYLEYLSLALLLCLFWNSHLGSISSFPLDNVRKSSYLRSLTFPAHTYLQLIPSFFTREADGMEGMGGGIGVVAIWWCTRKTVKRIWDVSSWGNK